jgi:hypothetical protein
MQKLDRSGWAAGLAFGSYGLRIGVRATNREFLAELTGCLPPRWKPRPGAEVDHLYSVVVGGAGPRTQVRRFHLLYVGPARLARSLEADEVVETFRADLELRVAEHARRRIFVHAGVVGWRGQAIVIPGRSFTGKSTLVAALVRAGADYYSDEFAVLDERGRVHAYPKPVSLRRDGGRRRLVSHEELGGRAGSEPLPVGRVVLTEYRSDARWRPRRYSPGRAVLELFANTVPARRRPAAALATLRRAVGQALVFKGCRGEADEVASRLLRDMS